MSATGAFEKANTSGEPFDVHRALMTSESTLLTTVPVLEFGFPMNENVLVTAVVFAATAVPPIAQNGAHGESGAVRRRRLMMCCMLVLSCGQATVLRTRHPASRRADVIEIPTPWARMLFPHAPSSMTAAAHDGAA